LRDAPLTRPRRPGPARAGPAALANPSISVSSSRVGSTQSLPAKANHVLTLTAGATAEELTVSVSPAAEITVTGAPFTSLPEGAGPSVAICAGRRSALHNAYPAADLLNEVTVTIAPGQTARLSADVELMKAPWVDETLDATWFIEPAQGVPFSVVSSGPLYGGPVGVELSLQATRAPDGHVVLSGTAEPDVDRGRIELWAYPPGRRTRDRRIGRVRVRNGAFSFNRFMPDRSGHWEFYARYRGGGRTFANDVSECNTFLRVR
jgi:hypothetical protein